MLPALIAAGASLAGGLLGSSNQKKADKRNADLQREFAQNSIQWKTEDARKAGIHPLFALGAPTYTPSGTYGSDTALPSAIASAGQDISRAVQAGSSSQTRLAAYEKTLQDLTLQKFGLENELLGAQIAKLRSQTGPAMPDLNSQGNDLVFGGNKWHANPGWSSANDVQNRYGEPAEWLYFPFVAGADVYHNAIRTPGSRPVEPWEWTVSP